MTPILVASKGRGQPSLFHLQPCSPVGVQLDATIVVDLWSGPVAVASGDTCGLVPKDPNATGVKLRTRVAYHPRVRNKIVDARRLPRQRRPAAPVGAVFRISRLIRKRSRHLQTVAPVMPNFLGTAPLLNPSAHPSTMQWPESASRTALRISRFSASYIATEAGSGMRVSSMEARPSTFSAPKP